MYAGKNFSQENVKIMFLFYTMSYFLSLEVPLYISLDTDGVTVSNRSNSWLDDSAVTSSTHLLTLWLFGVVRV